MIETDARSGLGRGRWLAVVLLLVTSALPRFHDLGYLSFYSDEMLTFMSARSVLEGEGAAMPSGMPYDRGLPFTWANAAVAQLLGTDSEFSYRVVAAAFGTVTPPVLFLTGTAFVTAPAAFVAASMLALSEWHVAFSRFGRMYSPFLFFFILASYFLWSWAQRGGRGRLVLGLVCFGCTLSLHVLGLFAAQFALIPLVLRGRAVREANAPGRSMSLGVGLGAPALGYLIDRWWIGRTYAEWSLPPGYPLPGSRPNAAIVQGVGSVGPETIIMLVLALVGVGAGLWLGWRWLTRVEGRANETDRLADLTVLGGVAAGGGFLGAGQLWGGALLVGIVLLLSRVPLVQAIRWAGTPGVLLGLLSAGWAGYQILTLGPGVGLRRLAEVPFPYLVLFWYQFPGLILVFLLGVAWLVWRGERAAEAGVVASVLGVLLPMAAIGFMQDWGGTRYLFQVYPFLLLAAGAVLVQGSGVATRAVATGKRAQVGAVVVALVIGLSGVTGGHGPRAASLVATLDHGDDVNPHIHIFPFRPDHRSAGEFVRARLEPTDIVVAEDVQAQFIYAGQADYWFRRAGDARKFLYLDADGVPRDIYVNSRLASTPHDVEAAVAQTEGRVWFITSGETEWQRDWYLSEDQRRWLSELEETEVPEFIAADGVTRVYCLNCAG